MRTHATTIALLLLAATVLGGCASQVRELMPTPAMSHLPTASSMFRQVPPARRVPDVDLLYITDRAPDPTAAANLPYGQARAHSLGFGSAVVRLEPTMEWDDLVQESLSHPRRQTIALAMGPIHELGRYPIEPYRLQVIPTGGVERSRYALERHRRAEETLQSEVQRRLEKAPTGQVMLYVHGFNETFATAAFTAAELCHFLGRAHVCAFFTWPASTRGNPLISYTSTTESAEYSIGHLKKVIRTLAQTPGVESLQLLAHSRGTALLLSAFRELALEAIVAGEDPAEVFKVRNLVLMSPDIDADVATQKIEIFASDPSITSAWKKQRMPRYLLGRMTTYSSPEDRALWLSKLLFRSQERLGELTPDNLSPAAQTYFDKVGTVDFIIYEGQRTDFFGHSYFTSNPRVSADLIELIRNDTPPGTPGRPLVRAGKVAWVFPD